MLQDKHLKKQYFHLMQVSGDYILAPLISGNTVYSNVSTSSYKNSYEETQNQCRNFIFPTRLVKIVLSPSVLKRETG